MLVSWGAIEKATFYLTSQMEVTILGDENITADIY